MKKELSDDAKMILAWQKDPLMFIRDVWGLRTKQKGTGFKKGLHITGQQKQLLVAVRNAVIGKGKRRISVRSGHGIGKTACLAWLVLWYLCCFYQS